MVRIEEEPEEAALPQETSSAGGGTAGTAAAASDRSSWPSFLTTAEQAQLGQPQPVEVHECAGGQERGSSTGVSKQVLSEGSGTPAERHGKALVHYRSWIESSGQVVCACLACCCRGQHELSA